MLHHRPVQDRHHRLRHVEGDRPQARAEPGGQDHRPHPISSLKRSIASTGSGSTPRWRGQLERDQVAQHHRPEQPLDAASRPPSRPGPRRAALGLDRLRGQLEAAARSAGAGRGPRGRSAARRSSPPRPAQPQSSLWSASGSSEPEGGELGVLVDLRLPAARDRRGQVGAVDDRDGARELARRSRGALLLQRLGLLGEEGGGGVDLGVDARRGAGQRRRPRRRRRTCRRPRRAAGRSPAGRPPARRSRAPGRPAAPPVLATRRRAPSASAASKQASVSSVVARVARAEHRPLGRRPARQRVAADGHQRPGQPVAERRRGEVAADRRAAHPADEQRRPTSAASRRADSIRQSASRSWSGMPRTSSIIGSAPGLSHPRRPSRRRLRPRLDRRRPRRGSSRSTRAPSPTVQPSSRTELAHLGAGGDRAARPRPPPAARARAGRRPRRRRRRTAPARSAAPAVATRPSRMSQVACR